MKGYKKIRGLRRRRCEIDNWLQSSLHLDLSRLMKYNLVYQKIWVYPWSNLGCKKQPPTDYRNQIFSGLIDIYFNWQAELEKLKQPYYLKIWLNDPRFMRSQVVAAIGEKIEYYNKIFPSANIDLHFPIGKFAAIKEKFNNLNWTPFPDEDSLCESDFDTHGKKLTKRFREKYSRKEIINNGEDTCYYKKDGIIWCSF